MRCEHCGWDALDRNGEPVKNLDGSPRGSHHPECKVAHRQQNAALHALFVEKQIDDETEAILRKADEIRARRARRFEEPFEGASADASKAENAPA